MQFGWACSQVQKAGKESVAAPCSMCWWDGMATMLTPGRRVCHRAVLDFGTASERSRPGMALLDRFRLTDRVALVTGAGRGIGQAIALAFAEMGADVGCAARTEKEIAATAARVRGFGRRALALRCDVTDPAQLEQLAGRAMADFGRVDLLVNNAGGFPPMPFLDTDLPSWEWCFRFNLTSAFVLTRACLPHMLAREGGALVHDQAARRRVRAARARERARGGRGGDVGAAAVPDRRDPKPDGVDDAHAPDRIGGGRGARRALALLAGRWLGHGQGGRGGRR